MPHQLPLGGAWTPNEALALNTLTEDRTGRYQICGPNAFNRCGFDGQIPTRVYAYNNRISSERRIGAVVPMLIKAADEQPGETDEVKLEDGQTVLYSPRVRTLAE